MIKYAIFQYFLNTNDIDTIYDTIFNNVFILKIALFFLPFYQVQQKALLKSCHEKFLSRIKLLSIIFKYDRDFLVEIISSNIKKEQFITVKYLLQFNKCTGINYDIFLFFCSPEISLKIFKFICYNSQHKSLAYMFDYSNPNDSFRNIQLAFCLHLINFINNNSTRALRAAIKNNNLHLVFILSSTGVENTLWSSVKN